MLTVKKILSLANYFFIDDKFFEGYFDFSKNKVIASPQNEMSLLCAIKINEKANKKLYKYMKYVYSIKVNRENLKSPIYNISILCDDKNTVDYNRIIIYNSNWTSAFPEKEFSSWEDALEFLKVEI